MPETCSHPKGAIAVPEKLAVAFSGDILPRPENTLIFKPKTITGKIINAFKKSSLVTGPSIAIGSMTGLVSFAQANPDPITTVMLVGTLGALSSMMAGSLISVFAFSSLKEGDGKFTPLPPTKQYLALEESKQKPVITPFNEWDNIFAKHDGRTQRMLTTVK